MVLLAAKGWDIIRIRWPNKIVLSGLFMLILLPGIVSDWKIIVTPEKAYIPREDGFQFFEDWTSGVADSLAELPKDFRNCRFK